MPVAAETAHNNGTQEPLPLDRVIQRGEQIGAGIDPQTGKPDTHRKTWTKADKLAAWSKGKPVDGQDESKVRRDVTGATLHWDDYGKDTVSQSWPLNHIDISILTVASQAAKFPPMCLDWTSSAIEATRECTTANRFDNKLTQYIYSSMEWYFERSHLWLEELVDNVGS